MNSSAFFANPLFILLVGIIIVVGGIIGLKLHPFLALLLGAFVVAMLTPAIISGTICIVERRYSCFRIAAIKEKCWGKSCN